MTRRRPRRASWCNRCQAETLPDETDAGRCDQCFSPTKASRDQFPDLTPDDEDA